MRRTWHRFWEWFWEGVARHAPSPFTSWHEFRVFRDELSDRATTAEGQVIELRQRVSLLEARLDRAASAMRYHP